MKKFLLGMASMAGIIFLVKYAVKKLEKYKKGLIIGALLGTSEGRDKLARAMIDPLKPIRKVKLTRKQKRLIKDAKKKHKSKKGQ